MSSDSKPAWHRPFRNAGKLALGRGARGLMSIGYVALAARTLGAEGFGMLILLNSVVLSLAQLSRFQTWQAVMRYGADHLERSDSGGFCGLLVFTFRLDLVTAVIAFGLFVVGFDWLAPLLGLDTTIYPAAQYYATLVFFIILSSTALGVLRLCDRHDLVAWHTVVEPLVRLLGAIGCALADASLITFVVVWFVSTAIGRSVAMVFAIGVLRERTLLPSLDTLKQWQLGLPRGIWRFVIGTHLTSSLNLGNTQLGVLLTGWLLGPAGAGYFRIASQFANVLIKPTSKLLVPAIFTDMAELTARGESATRRHVVQRSMLIAGGAAGAVFLLLAVCGELLLTVIFGEAYGVVYPLMLWLAAAGLVTVIVFPLEPLLISAGRVRAVVLARGVALLVYLLGFHTMALTFGLVGAGIATVLAATVTALLFWLFGSRLMNNNKSEQNIKP